MGDIRRRTVTALVYAAVVLIAVLAPPAIFAVGLVVIAVLALVELVGLQRAGLPVLLELFLLGLGLASLLFLRGLEALPGFPLLMTIFAVWAADVVGYIVGSSFGRHKIIPRISPGKTWEGTIAGFLASAAVVALANNPFVGIHIWWVVTAVLVGPAAFVGDLLESWVKRRAGVKDSGRLLPGHGGVLDRIDSLLTAAPLVAATIVYLGRMG